jgi:S1-C subfamily serine protease
VAGKTMLFVAIVLIAVAAGFAARPFVERHFFPPSKSAIEPGSSLAGIERTTVELFERVAPSVVEITTVTKASDGSSSRIDVGSGFFWDAAGNIVTNEHVIRDSQSIEVWFRSGEHLEAEIVGLAPNYDIAVIRPKGLAQVPRPIPVATSSNLKIGQWIFAIGSPFGLDQSLTTGVISAMKRQMPTRRGRSIANIIQTDAAIYPGSSGGPLLNSAGQVIGVNTVAYAVAGTGNALGFAIPIDVVKTIVPDLVSKGRIPTPGIGIVPAGESQAMKLKIEGVIIARIRPGSPADLGGLKGMDQATGAVGDVITGANGHRVQDVFDLTEQLERLGVGSKISLVIARSGQSRTVEIEIVDIDLKS